MFNLQTIFYKTIIPYLKRFHTDKSFSLTNSNSFKANVKSNRIPQIKPKVSGTQKIIKNNETEN